MLIYCQILLIIILSNLWDELNPGEFLMELVITSKHLNYVEWSYLKEFGRRFI